MSKWSETVSRAVLRVPLAPDDLALLKAIGETSGHALGVVCIEAGLDHRQKGLAVAHRRMLYLEKHSLVRRLDDRKPIVWLRTPEGSEQLRLWEDDPLSVLPLPEGGGRRMSPDLARLCDAVEVVCNHHGMVTCDADHEAIVRAVLTELRDPSGAMIRSMCRAMSPGRRPTPERVSVAEKHTIRWQAVIDRMLEDPSAPEVEAPAAGVPVREGE